MGSITTAATLKWKRGLLTSSHNHDVGGDLFKLGLFKITSELAGNYDKFTEKYQDITDNFDENDGTGYTAGGIALTNVAPMVFPDGVVSSWSNNLIWADSTISSDGAFIYNDSHADDEIVLISHFPFTLSSLNGVFELQFPPFTAPLAILRLA